MTRCSTFFLFFFWLAAYLDAATPFKPNLGPEVARIDFRGKAMTTESSAYGTVFSFPDVGFIGTAHLENEPEELVSLSFYLDGQRVETPTAELKGTTFRLERKSRVRKLFDLTCVVEIKDDRIYETTTVHTDAEVPLKLVYHFMHAWRPSVDAYAAGVDAEPEKKISGPLRDDAEVAKKFYITQRVDWMAVHEPLSGQFAVSRLLEAPELGKHVAMLWNVPGTYRKFYLMCFDKSTVPAGFTGTWKMVTAFGASEAETWEKEARRMAKEAR